MNDTVGSDVLDLSLVSLSKGLGKDVKVRTIDTDSYGRLAGSFSLGHAQLPFVVLESGTLREILNLRLKQVYAANTVYVVPFLNKDARERCNEESINFLDTTGNCRLVAQGVTMLVDRHDTAPRRSVTQGRAFQYNGLKVIHDIYQRPDLLTLPYRELSRIVGVSTGSLSGIFEDLRAEQYLLKTDVGFKLTNGMQLARRWAYAYLDTVRPKLYRATFRRLGEDTIERITQSEHGEGVLIGGEKAAELREGYLAAPSFCVYSSLRIPELMKLRLVPFTKQRPEYLYTEILTPFSTVGVTAAENQQNLYLVSDLIILADLLNSHEPRSLEAAEHLIEHAISDTLQRAGFYL